MKKPRLLPEIRFFSPFFNIAVFFSCSHFHQAVGEWAFLGYLIRHGGEINAVCHLPRKFTFLLVVFLLSQDKI